MKSSLALAVPALWLVAACGSDALPPLFQPQPECEGDAVVPFAGDHQNVISTLEIGHDADGFDLDGDGLPDNKLAAVGSLAGSSIRDAIAGYDLLIPFEFFDLPSVATDECVKFAIYLGHYKLDHDGDGAETVADGGDCDDTRVGSLPGAAEAVGDGVDNDCDGLADEAADNTPSTSGANLDGDDFTIAQGDCDDSAETGATVGPGMPEVCGDGLDNDCNGLADDAADCDPYTTVQTIDVDPLSLDTNGDAVIAFTNGTITDGKLVAGPSIFEVSIPTGLGDLALDLKISGAQIEADVVADGDSVRLDNARLGGILDVRTMDGIRGLTVDQIGLTPENSLLDATFANILGTILALPDSKQPEWVTCKTPDIDVDRDGLEVFCDSDPTDDNKAVDTCIDGDGTVITDTADTQCTEALLPDGKPRFVDGISVELNFTTVPTTLRAPT